jgi:hypothetical protein
MYYVQLCDNHIIDRAEELQKLILQRIEEREKEIVAENAALREAIQSIQLDLVGSLMISMVYGYMVVY